MRNRILTIFFCLMLFLIPAVSILLPDHYYSEQEKRKLMQFSDITIKALMTEDQKKQIETYLTDQFPLRDHWITLKTCTELVLGKRESGGVFIMGDHYLIDKFSSYDKKQCKENIDVLKQFSKKLKKKEIPFTMMLVPSAAEILTDKLPTFAPHADQKAIIDEADAQTDAVLDISSILKEHAGEDIYYRTDHHWTSLGAYYAYTAWQKKRGFSARSLSEFQKEILCENFRGTTWAKVSLPSKQYMDTITGYYTEKKRRIVYNGGAYITDNIYENEYLKGNDQYGVFFNSNQILTVIEGGGNKGNLLLIKDSYANTFAQFVLDDYKEIHMIDMRFFRDNLLTYIKHNNISEVLVLYGISGFANNPAIPGYAIS